MDKGDPQHLSLSSKVRLIEIAGDDKSKMRVRRKKFNRAGVCYRETGVNVRWRY